VTCTAFSSRAPGASAQPPQVGGRHVAVDLDGAGTDGRREFRDPRGFEQVSHQHGLRVRGQPPRDGARLRFADFVLGAVGEADQKAERGGAAC
jgi:hypothetical protein